MRKRALHAACIGFVALALAGSAGFAQEPVDAGDVFVKEALARSMTPEQLQAHKQRMARLARTPGARARVPDSPGDTCPLATTELPPYPTFSDTTVGAVDNYDLPAAVTAPTCTAPTTCTGAGPASSLPRGAIYTGTGTAPDRAFKLRLPCDCALTISATPQAAWDLALIVYQATCSSLLSDCACVDDTGVAGQGESVALNALADTDYFVVIDGYSTGGTPPSGPYTLSVAAGPGCVLLCPVDLQEFSLQ